MTIHKGSVIPASQMMIANEKKVNTAAVRILLADTNWWANSARLAIGLNQAGCEVSAICPTPSHALMKTRAVHHLFRYDALTPLESLNSAIAECKPDVIVPCCDRSVGHLHELYGQASARGAAGKETCALIERSLGLPESYSVVSSRHELLALAREEGIRVPETNRIGTAEEFESWHARAPYPWVLKADRTWGGSGVRVVRCEEEASNSLKQLAKMSRIGRAVKRLIVNRDPFWIRDWWVRSERRIIAQSFIQGRPANCAVVCWQGKVLAGIAVEVARSEGATGPASVVCIVENSEMMKAADKIAVRLGLSGFFGLDFMIENGSNKEYLIEMNPRLAPPCHLRLGKGRDLAGALWAQLAGKPLPESQAVTQSDLVAYFPQGLRNESNLPPDCFRDIPRGEPELVSELLNPFPDRTFLFRLIQHLTRKPIPDGNFDRNLVSADGDSDQAKSEIHEAANETAISQSVAKARARST